MRAIEWAWLGRLPYARALTLQERVHADVVAGRAPETLLLLEHDPVITLGRHADAAHVLAGAEALRRAGITVLGTSRGGDVTYHGPGQLVGYPIFRLPRGIKAHVAAMAGAVVAVLADLGIMARLAAGATRSLGRRRQDLRRRRAGSPARHPARLRAQRERGSRRLWPHRSLRAARRRCDFHRRARPARARVAGLGRMAGRRLRALLRDRQGEDSRCVFTIADRR